MISFAHEIIAGEERILGGCHPRRADVGALFAVFGAEVGLIPRAQWSPVTYRHKVVRIMDQDGAGACFPPGTRIRMEDGSQRCIEDVKLCDHVLTAEGNIGHVIRTIVRREKTRVLRLILRGHRHLRLTDEHPVLTQRGYVRACELTLSDWVAMPRYAPQSTEWISTAEHIPERTRIRTCRQEQTYGIPGKAVRTVVRNGVPDVISLTPGVGRIIGFFLAEGNSDYSKVNWTFGSHEKDTLAQELVDLLKTELGAEAAVRVRKSKAVVSLYGVQWARLFESLCSTGSGRVRLHQQLASGPRDFLEAVFRAWMDGDHVDETSGVTISHDLALNMFDIANMLGIRPGIQTLVPNLSPGVRSRQLRWTVAWGDENATKGFHCQMDDRHMWRRVVGVEPEPYDGWVYNLEIEGDNSYVAEGVGVHNCNAFASVQALETCRSLCGQVHVDLFPGNLYGRINGGRDAGSALGDGLSALMDKGVIPQIAGMDAWQWGHGSRPSGWETEGAKFRILEAFDCPTFDHIATAIQCGFLVDYGIMVGRNFDVESDGWVGEYRGGGGGHALCGVGLVERGGKWGILTANSWGEKWGDKGFGVVPESYFRGNFNDAWAVRAVTTESSDTEPALS